MPFKKGQKKPASSGRKKGTVNKRTLLRVEETLLELGMNPIEEIIELMTKLKAAQRIEIWLELYKFLEAPRRASEEPRSSAIALSPLSPVGNPNVDTETLLSV